MAGIVGIPFTLLESVTEEGVVAVGGDLSPARLLWAYRRGMFPWYDASLPVLWWSPDPRCILPLDRLYVSQRLRRTLKKPWVVTFDTAFAAVIAACAQTYRPTQRGTWILPEVVQAYTRLHELGHAHSVEVWQDDALCGGLYGVALGGVFFGESMFHRTPDASKVALVHLVRHLRRCGFSLLDCQQQTGHLIRMGAVVVPRHRFVQLLELGIQQGQSLF